MIKIYRRTGTIKADQFDGSDAMVKKYHISVYNENIDKYGGLGKSIPNEYIFNGIYIHIGDWIVTGVSGGHWTIADDLFNKTYTELPVIPKAVSEYIEDAKASHYELLDAMAKWTLDQPVFDWIHENSDAFARAWLDGYDITDSVWGLEKGIAMKMNGGYQYCYSEVSKDGSTSRVQIDDDKVQVSVKTNCPVCQEHHDILGLTDMFNLHLKEDVLVLMDTSHNNVRFPRDTFKIKYCPFCGRKL